MNLEKLARETALNYFDTFIDTRKDVQDLSEHIFAVLRQVVEKTLAERCFEDGIAQDELFNSIQEILGGESICGNSLKPDFKFKAIDVWTDSYDSSVEIVLASDTEPITREQADKILALGFRLVYESQGARGVQWAENKRWKCLPSTGRDGEKREVAKLRAELIKRDEILKAAKVFLDKVEMVSNDRRFIGVFMMSQIHNSPYEGPTYNEELKNLKEAFARYED